MPSTDRRKLGRNELEKVSFNISIKSPHLSKQREIPIVNLTELAIKEKNNFSPLPLPIVSVCEEERNLLESLSGASLLTMLQTLNNYLTHNKPCLSLKRGKIGNINVTDVVKSLQKGK